MRQSHRLLVLWLVSTAFGCSTEKDVIVPADSGATPDAGAPEGTGAGAEIGSPPGNPEPWNPAIARGIRANESGGLFGGVCAEYTVDVASKRYTSRGCDPSATPVQRTLTPAQYAQVDAALAKLKRHTGMNCGADKPIYTVEIETTDGAKTLYWDSFYACQGTGRIYVDNIDAVMTTLRNLAN